MKKKDMFFISTFLVCFMLCVVVMAGDFLCKNLEKNYHVYKVSEPQKQEAYIEDVYTESLKSAEHEEQFGNEIQGDEHLQSSEQLQSNDEVQGGKGGETSENSIESNIEARS